MRKQRGVTMIGWVFLLAPMAIVLYAGIRVVPGRRTYPGFFPLVHLDHIYYEGARVEVDRVWLPKDRLALMASDHLPLVADLLIRA